MSKNCISDIRYTRCERMAVIGGGFTYVNTNFTSFLYFISNPVLYRILRAKTRDSAY